MFSLSNTDVLVVLDAWGYQYREFQDCSEAVEIRTYGRDPLISDEWCKKKKTNKKSKTLVKKCTREHK